MVGSCTGVHVTKGRLGDMGGRCRDGAGTEWASWGDPRGEVEGLRHERKGLGGARGGCLGRGHGQNGGFTPKPNPSSTWRYMAVLWMAWQYSMC